MDTKIVWATAILAILGIAVYKTRKMKFRSNLFLFLFMTLFALLIAEFAYRFFFREKAIFSTVNHYYNTDPYIGFRFNPGIIKAVEYVENGDTIYNTHYTILPDTNNFGIDYPMRKGYKSDTSIKETVFLGCSYTLGEGLADEETLAWQYGKLAGTSTVNRGCNGMGVHQVYELFKREYAGEDNHNRVFVYSFFHEHFFRAKGIYPWNVAGPSYIIAGDTLLNQGPFYKVKTMYWQKISKAASFLGTFTFISDNIERIATDRAKRKLSDENLAPLYLMFRQMAEIAEKTGGKLILLNWDSDPPKTGSAILDRDIVDGKIIKTLSHTSAKVLPVRQVIDYSIKQYFIPGDGHPSALANKALAEYLLEHTRLQDRDGN
ncbi:MAG: hypothetical protein JNK14_07290 [Chitinophagaceae bacterium]|nr:hypothetical protein [Chitinophagaceae bacterium]